MIDTRRGIFQGDRLSPLWFCLAKNLLSKLINRHSYEYILDKSHNTEMSHQMYIDDLKLYAANEDLIEYLLKIVASFTKTIGMEMSLNKCSVVHVERGKILEGEGLTVMKHITIKLV